MKSIMQENKGYCYICAKIYGNANARRDLAEHHIFEGNGRRKLSEKYGLKVYLCPEHHLFGEDAVHKLPNQGYDLLLKQIGQARFQQVHKDLDFIAIFGKNYLNIGAEEHT